MPQAIEYAYINKKRPDKLTKKIESALDIRQRESLRRIHITKYTDKKIIEVDSTITENELLSYLKVSLPSDIGIKILSQTKVDDKLNLSSSKIILSDELSCKSSEEVNKADKILDKIHKNFNLSSLPPEDITNVVGELTKAFNLKSGATNLIAYELGEILFIIKQWYSPKDFAKYVDEKLGKTRKTANNYILLYNICKDLPELKKLKVSIIYLIGKEDFPLSLKKILAENIDICHDYKKRDLLTLQANWMSGKIGDKDQIFRSFSKEQKKKHVQALLRESLKPSTIGMTKAATRLEVLLKRQKDELSTQNGGKSCTNKPLSLAMWEKSIEIINTAKKQLEELTNNPEQHFPKCF